MQTAGPNQHHLGPNGITKCSRTEKHSGAEAHSLDTHNTSTRRTEQRRSKSTELHIPDWMTGGRAGGHSSIRDGGSSQRAEKRMGRHELMAATGSSTADERAAGEAVKVQQIDDERVVDELLLLCRDDGSWTGGRRLRNGRIRDGRGRRDGRTGGSAAGGDEDDGTDGHGADREDGGGSRRAGAAAPLPRPDRRWDREDDELSRDGGGGRRRIPSWRGKKWVRLLLLLLRLDLQGNGFGAEGDAAPRSKTKLPGAAQRRR